MRILLATEGSSYSRAAIDKCGKLFGGLQGIEFLILSVAEPVFVPIEPFAISADYLAEAETVALENSKKAVSEAEERLRSMIPGVTSVSTKIVTDGAAPAILEEAERWKADLIVMGSHGYGFWQRAFLGSVSNSVVHQAPCSVLIVRPGSNDATEHPES